MGEVTKVNGLKKSNIRADSNKGGSWVLGSWWKKVVYVIGWISLVTYTLQILVLVAIFTFPK